MKATACTSISIAVRISAVSFLSATMIFLTNGPVAAGGLHFSRTWQILNADGAPIDEITTAVMKCASVAAYSDIPGDLNGAWIAGGPTKKDRQVIVKLLRNGDLKKTCKVKITGRRVFKSCTCQ